MDTNNKSELRLYSLGIVVETKKDDTDLIKVSPTEILPLQNGLLSEQKRDYTVKMPNASGVQKSSEIKGDDVVVAKWIPFGHSNRITAPDVVEGETVILFRFADNDEYHWTTLFREPSLRRLETVMYAFSDIAAPGQAFDKDSSYYFEVSTKEKHVTFKTSKADGEPYAYLIDIDTGKGLMTVIDDVRNEVSINSKTGEIKVKTNEKVTIETKTAEIKASQINLKGPVQITGALTVSSGITAGSNISTPANIAAGGTVSGTNIT